MKDKTNGIAITYNSSLSLMSDTSMRFTVAWCTRKQIVYQMQINLEYNPKQIDSAV